MASKKVTARKATAAKKTAAKRPPARKTVTKKARKAPTARKAAARRASRGRPAAKPAPAKRAPAARVKGRGDSRRWPSKPAKATSVEVVRPRVRPPVPLPPAKPRVTPKDRPAAAPKRTSPVSTRRAASVAKAQASPFTATLDIPARKLGSDEAVRATFVLTNTSDTAYLVNPACTPLEGMLSDCLRVTREGKRVDYDGPMIKRALLPLEKYLRVAPGKSLSSEIVVNDGYELYHEGRYRIAVDTDLFQFVKEEVVTAPVAGGAAMMFKADRSARRANLSAKPSQVEVVATPAAPRMTMGARARVMAKTTSAAAALLVTSDPDDPDRVSKEQQVRQAFADAIPLLDNALAKVGDNPHYGTWFGTHKTQRSNTVTSNLTKIKDQMRNSTFTLNITGSGCRSGVYAYTYKGAREIWLCDAFWSAPATGINSKAGTMVHEASHAVARTDDHEYGEDDCKKLARNDPDRAINNADNYEYFAEHA